MIRFVCPQCQAKLSAPDDRAGAASGCPRCRTRVQVPAAVPAAVAEQPFAELAAAPSTPPLSAPTAEPAPASAQPKSRSKIIVLAAGLTALALFGIGALVWSNSSSSKPTEVASAQTKSQDRTETKAASEASPGTSRTVAPSQTTAKLQPTNPSLPLVAETPVSTLPPSPNSTDGTSPLLVLDAGGHSSVVREIAFTPDNQRLVSVSFDKSLRIWDVASGEMLQVIRLPIGPGPEGQLNALALSPDGRLAAVSGMPFGMGKFGIPIHVLSLETGLVKQVLKGGNQQVISALAFSPDGQRLLAGSNNGEAALYEMATGKVLFKLAPHKEKIFKATFSPDGKHMATASSDKTGRIWSATTGQIEAELKGHDSSCLSVAWSPDGKRVAVGHIDATVCLYDAQGKLQTTISGLKNQLTSLTWTPDGQRLLYTGVGWGPNSGGEYGAALVDVASGKVGVRFTGHTNTVMHGTISANGLLAASTGGNDNDIYVWKTSDASIVQHMVGKGRTPFGVGYSADGRSIAFGNINANVPPNPHPIKRTFRLDQLEFGPPPDASFRRARMVRGDLELRRGPDFTVVLFKGGQRVHDIPMPGGKRELCSCWSFVSDELAVVGTTFGLYLIDVHTKQIIKRYSGHASTVHAIAPSPDNRGFVTGSPDETICLWRVDQQQPMLSLFFAEDEWIAWTPQGYYAASALGERLMGWQVNRGVGSIASYYPAAQFRKSLYRPDVIKLLPQTPNLQQALAMAGKNNPGSIQPVTVAQVLPPMVAITSPSSASSIYTKESKIEVRASAQSVGQHPVTAMRLLIDGRPYKGHAGVRTIAQPRLGEVQQSWSVDLAPGKHVIAVQAESKVSKGLSSLIEVNCTSGKATDLPTLYILAVGINAYPGQMRLTYATPDATAIVEAFGKSKAFGSVKAKLITDKQATKSNILQAMDQLAGLMTPQDVGIVFFSGHGGRDDDGNLYLIPVDVNPRNFEGSCISGDSLKAKLGEMPGRLIAILDACHSGAAAETGNSSRPARPLTDDLVRDLVTDDYGVIVMSASQGREYALESPEVGHGFFTYALVEGLAGKADLNRDGAVFVNELEAYTAQRVKQLTNDEQHPASARPPNIRPFVLAKP